MEFMIVKTDSDITHHGVLGQKWGVRRYQNKDGTLTSEGKKRYSSTEAKKDSSEETNKDTAFLEELHKVPFFKQSKREKRLYDQMSDSEKDAVNLITTLMKLNALRYITAKTITAGGAVVKALLERYS